MRPASLLDPRGSGEPAKTPLRGPRSGEDPLLKSWRPSARPRGPERLGRGRQDTLSPPGLASLRMEVSKRGPAKAGRPEAWARGGKAGRRLRPPREDG